ncbi:MAG TPA: GNAT family N-acetyltransferase [Gammaproteobacteria bacterium]|nr:GNAT family N-acetyltransferase [Gammaproteobacteria bacterium]
MRIIEPVTPGDYEKYYDLRWAILRAPWNQPRGSERDSLDADSTHLLMLDDRDRAVAVGRLHFNSIREARIRYMAVAIGHQRRGCGSRLLLALEQKAASLGAACIVLDARETALGFYRKRGYEIDGPGHTLYNCISHVRMRKTL